VCGDDVIIFSDKSISWPDTGDIALRWSRWYRRAVKKSVDQIRGAERWLRDFPERIFIDPICTQRLPIALPPLGQRRVHGIAVALGAQAACREYFGDKNRSLAIVPSLKGQRHTTDVMGWHGPFAIGDVDPGDPFVHVFDETALDLVMLEMDTMSDFVRYLEERKGAIREERFVLAAGEAELVALYLQSANASGEHVPRISRMKSFFLVLLCRISHKYQAFMLESDVREWNTQQVNRMTGFCGSNSTAA